MVASVSRTLSIGRRKTPIVVLQGSGYRIAIQTKKPTRCCGAIGPTPVKTVQSYPSARPGQSDGSRDGNTSICSTLCSSALNPLAMRQRRETVEHPFGTMKARMGATHFLTKTLPKVAAEMALSVLAYNLTRVMNMVGTKPLVAAIAV
jgi:hypothetical protein